MEDRGHPVTDVSAASCSFRRGIGGAEYEPGHLSGAKLAIVSSSRSSPVCRMLSCNPNLLAATCISQRGSNSSLCKRCEQRVEITVATDFKDDDLLPMRPRARFHVGFCPRIVGIYNKAPPVWLPALALASAPVVSPRDRSEEGYTCDIAVWPVEARNEPGANRVSATYEDDRNRRCRCFD
jgi:hypothetical protein